MSVTVMRGLVPHIRAKPARLSMFSRRPARATRLGRLDGRDKHGHDEWNGSIADHFGACRVHPIADGGVKVHLTDFRAVFGIMLNDLKILIFPNDERMRELISLQAVGLTPIEAVRY